MSSNRTELGPVVHDPASRSYDAVVRFCEGTDVEAYRCRLTFPVETSPTAVASALVRQAREMHRRAREPMNSLSGADATNIVPFARSQRPSVPGLRRSA